MLTLCWLLFLSAATIRVGREMVRVIVGKLGAGKTVYLRRLQDFQAHQDSVYADVPQQSLPKTEVIVKACQWF
jgi:type II secretory pathway predicted ATPase ExeA